MAFSPGIASFAKEPSMIAVPRNDPVHALVPHTLEEPICGAASGPLAGLSFMVKDLFAIAGGKVSNGNPDFYEHDRTRRAREMSGLA
jgi:Asp-tRNA(Asn)/Glu-tRNA(Gln) amidotransferase A subunit family amidase